MNIVLPTLQAPPVHPVVQLHTPGDVQLPWRQDGVQTATDKIIITYRKGQKLSNDKNTKLCNSKLIYIIQRIVISNYEATSDPHNNSQYTTCSGQDARNL